MNDFYDRLKQSIIEGDVRDTGARVEIYAQARRSMIRQLWAQHPPLAEDEIDRRIGDFDTAVERVEADLAATFDGEDLDQPPPEDAVYPEPAFEQQVYGWSDYGESDAPPPQVAAYQDAADGVPDNLSFDDATQQRADARSISAKPGFATTMGGQPLAEEEAPPARVRWSEDPGARGDLRPTRLPPARARPGRRLSEQDRVRVLLGTIGVLVVILAGFVVYLLLPSGDDGVTLPISVRREVSDAATATRIAAEALNVRRSFVLFDGRDPTLFESTPDNPVRLDSDGDGGFVRVASSTNAAGAKAVIGPGLAAQLASQSVRVVITARSSAERGAATMRFAYQSGLAISHWQTADLLPDYATIGLLWRPPAMQTSTSGANYLLIEPGIPGDGTGTDIRTIRIDLLADDGG